MAGWDTRPREDVTGAEVFEEDEKCVVESTDISTDLCLAELVAALLPACYRAAHWLSLACLLFFVLP